MTGTYGRERAPERACLKRHEWPGEDRQIWEAALKLLIPRQAAHRFRDDGAHPFRLIAAQCSD
jgi:hypothetical protein